MGRNILHELSDIFFFCAQTVVFVNCGECCSEVLVGGGNKERVKRLATAFHFGSVLAECNL